MFAPVERGAGCVGAHGPNQQSQHLIMKPNYLAALIAIVPAMYCADVCIAAEVATGPLSVISGIVVRIDGVRPVLADDSLLVVDDRTGQPICVVTCERHGIVTMVANGILRGTAGSGVEIDMRHLDASSVGVLDLYRDLGRWILTHRFDAGRITAGQLEDLVARFVGAATATRLRFGGALSIGEGATR
jgi:hypothetical protein